MQVSATGQIGCDRVPGGEEFCGEGIGLAFLGYVAGGGVTVQDQVGEFMGGGEAVSIDVVGPGEVAGRWRRRRLCSGPRRVVG
jgi:hypothetical protein